jgi:hypothetical protein
MAVPQRENCAFGFNRYVTTVAVGQSRPLYSGVGIFIFNWYNLSSPPQIPRFPGVQLETRGLASCSTVQALQ